MIQMPNDHWLLGVFTSLDTGLGISLEVLSELNLPTIHLHAPHQGNRTHAIATQLSGHLKQLNVHVTCMFAGFSGESYLDIPTVEKTVGLVPRDTRIERVKELREIAQFAAIMGVGAVGLHLGFVPYDESSADYQELVELTRDFCEDCKERDQAVHLETGQESSDVLLRFLEDVDQPNLFINFDPANMILYGCGEPLEALEKVGMYVRSVHCKDAKWSDSPGVTWGQEVPLGTGDVDFKKLLTILSQFGYTGPLTIEREIPHEPERQQQEIRQAVQFLNQLKNTLAC